MLAAKSFCVGRRRVSFPDRPCFMMEGGTMLLLTGTWYLRSTNGRLTGSLPACGTAS